MALRSLEDVWIDANFKETQLADLRIGQPVEIRADAYPGRVYRGRVAGFGAGTGASTALLPPENATGNFVKVVQRLPVRIDLVDGNPPEAPLFIGLSVEPVVKVREPATGPVRRPEAPAPGGGRGPRPRRRPGDRRRDRRGAGDCPRRTVNPWLIALTVTIATFMEVLDTSIANVALPHIAGDLGASLDDANWVLTSYLVANAMIIPLSSWLSTALGRKRYYMGCVALFTLTSALCGLATSLAHADRLADRPGDRRRRPPAGLAGDPAGHLPRRAAGRRHGRLRRGRADGAGAGPDPRRLDHRQLLVAVDLLHQHPRRLALAAPEPPAGRGPRVPAGRAGRDPPPRPADRLRRHRPDRPGAGVPGGRARQGPGMGLVRLAAPSSC